MAELTDIRETVRKCYAAAASAAERLSIEEGGPFDADAGRCRPRAVSPSPADETGVFWL
jgi:hypothetical protein